MLCICIVLHKTPNISRSVVPPVSRHWSSTFSWSLSFFLAHSFSLKEADGVSVFYSQRPSCTCLLFRALKRLIHEGFDSTEKGALHPSLLPRSFAPLSFSDPLLHPLFLPLFASPFLSHLLYSLPSSFWLFLSSKHCLHASFAKSMS